MFNKNIELEEIMRKRNNDDCFAAYFVCKAGESKLFHNVDFQPYQCAVVNSNW